MWGQISFSRPAKTGLWLGAFWIITIFFGTPSREGLCSTMGIRAFPKPIRADTTQLQRQASRNSARKLPLKSTRFRHVEQNAQVGTPDMKLPDNPDLDDYFDLDEQDDPALYDLEFGMEDDQVEDELEGRGFDQILGEEYKVKRIEDPGERVLLIEEKMRALGDPVHYDLTQTLSQSSDMLHSVEFRKNDFTQFKNNTVMMRAHPLEVGWMDEETELIDEVDLEKVFEMDKDTSEYDEIERNEVHKFHVAVKKLMDMMPKVETNPLAPINRHPHLAEGYDVPIEMQIDDRFSPVYQADEVMRKHNLTEVNLDDIMYEGINTLEKVRARRKRHEARRKEQGLAPAEVDFRWRYDGELSDLTHEMVDKLNFKQLRTILAVHATEERFENVDLRRNGTWDDLRDRMHNLLDVDSFQARIERQKKRKWALLKVHYTMERLNFILDMQKNMYPYGGYYELGKKWLEELKEWTLASGGYLDKVALHEEQLFEERCMLAEQDIATDDVVMIIRNDLMITSDVARSSPIGTLVAKRCPNITNDHYVMAVFLCQERLKGEESFWAKYIQALPKKLQNVPYRIPGDEGPEVLRGTYAGYFMGMKTNEAITTFEDLSKGLPLNVWKRRVSFEMFMWAIAVVDSRAFKLSISPDITISALVPVVDMINANVEPTVRWEYDSDMDSLVVTALKDLKKGDELSITLLYLPKNITFTGSIYQAMLAFDDPNGKTVSFAVMKTYEDRGVQKMFSHLRRQQKDMTNMKDLIEAGYVELNSTLDELYIGMIGDRRRLYDRIRDHEEILGEMEQLNQILGSDDFPEAQAVVKFRMEKDPAQVGAGTCTSEIEVLKIIKEAAEKQIRLQGSTLMDDLEHLRDLDEDVFGNDGVKTVGKRRKCMLVKVAEKMTLKYFIDLANKCIPMLQMSRSSLKQYRRETAKAKRKGDKLSFEPYISTVVMPLLKQRLAFQDLQRKGKLPSVDTTYSTQDETELYVPPGQLPFPWKEATTSSGAVLYVNPATLTEQWDPPGETERLSAQDVLRASIRSRYVRMASTWKPIQLEGPDGMNKEYRDLDYLIYQNYTPEEYLPRTPPPNRVFQWEDTRFEKMINYDAE